MSNNIILKKSSVGDKVPLSGDLEYGELALNYTDGNLFYKNSSNVITTLTSNKFVSVTGNVTGGNIVSAGIVSATGNITGNYFIGNGSQLTGVAALLSGNLSGNIQGNGFGANSLSFVSATGNVNATNFFASGVFYGDGSGLTGISATGGYFNSTLTSFPTGDYGNGEPFVQQGATTDAFGITIVPNFTCMDPQGSIQPAVDLGTLI
jgi:hypothetical protein